MVDRTMDAIKPHKVMAAGCVPAGDFGVSEYPGRGRESTDPDAPIKGRILPDSERAVGKPISRGKGMMAASRNPDHGPHRHYEEL